MPTIRAEEERYNHSRTILQRKGVEPNLFRIPCAGGAEGRQNALWAVAGAPLTIAVTASRPRCARGSGPGYDALCAHYGMQPTRNYRGISYENDGIESPHGHLEKAVRGALLIRGIGDCDDLISYRRFIDEIVSRNNAHHARRIEAGRPPLQLLHGQ